MSSIRKKVEFIDELYMRPASLLTYEQIEAILRRAEETGTCEADIMQEAIDQFFRIPDKVQTIDGPKTSKWRKVSNFIDDGMFKIFKISLTVVLIVTYLAFAKAAFVYVSTHEDAEIDRDYELFHKMVRGKSQVEEMPGRAEE